MNPTDLRTRDTMRLSPALLLFLFACGGGGCSSCDGCGVEPIAGGFPIEQRVANSAQIRLTESGLQFMEENASSLVSSFLPDGLNFDVPPTMTTVDLPGACLFSGGDGDIEVCTDGTCVLAGELTSLDLEPVGPNRLRATIRVQLESRSCTSRAPDGTCTASESGRLSIRVSGGGACSGRVSAQLDTRRGGRQDIGIVADLAFSEESRAARRGYTFIDVQSVGLEEGRDIEDDDIDLDGESGVLGFLTDLLGGLIKGLIVDAVQDQIGGMLQGAVDDQLCTRTGEYGCPNGTVSDDAGDPESICRFSAGGECVPQLLGQDGQGDLGQAFLGSISPGTHAPGQFLMASGGQAESVNNGLSLFMYGGFIGTDLRFENTPAHNPCVPRVDPPALPNIPRVATFRANTVPGLSSAPHVGIGMSESFLNHAGYGLYDSGMLCIGAGTNLSQQLSTGLLSAFVMGIGDLAFPAASGPMAIALRPQAPPNFEIGGGSSEEDPLLNITMEGLEVDFYVFSAERYVRVMTYTADLSIPLNLTVRDGQIVPEVIDLAAENGVVTNSEGLLTEDPALLSSLIDTALSAAADMALGDLGGFDLPAFAGLQLEVAEGGLRGIDESGEEFLGIFANLSPAPPGAYVISPETELVVGDASFDPSTLQLETLGEAGLPSVPLFFDVEERADDVEYEYSVRLNGGLWSDWTQAPEITFSHRAMLLQARHQVEARARVVGLPESVDHTPASGEFIIDILAPRVQLTTLTTGVQVDIDDIVSDEIEVRFRTEEGSWSQWERFEGELLIPEFAVEVEARDESGNVGSATQGIIRGRANPAIEGSGCACEIPGQSSNRPLGALLLLGLFVFVRRPRREQKTRKEASRKARHFPMTLLSLVIASSGCDCGGDDDMMMDASVPDATEQDAETDSMPPMPVALSPGLLGQHLDMVETASGTIVFSGYSPGRPTRFPYGDLVVGAFDASTSEVDWQIVDGVPDDEPTGDTAGWRGGVVPPGDDVGTYTSIAAEGDTLIVTYFDATNGNLKCAVGNVGGPWSIHIIDDGDWAGAHASLFQRPGGGYAIAYAAVRPPSSVPGRPTSQVRVATTPGTPSAGSWTISVAGETEVNCRAQFCPATSSCVEAGACTNSPGEQIVLGEDYVEDHPPIAGLFASIAESPDGSLGLVYYDRNAGNLMAARQMGSSWVTQLVDGYGREALGVGDSGLAASLAIDSSGTWHVSYVDGAEEVLRYARFTASTPPTYTIIDDGTTDGTTMHDDGRHIVGDDSSLVVLDSGEIRVTYQDATTQTLMFASSTDNGDTWSLSVIDDENSTGYFATQKTDGSASTIGTWWRAPRNENGIRVFTR